MLRPSDIPREGSLDYRSQRGLRRLRALRCDRRHQLARAASLERGIDIERLQSLQPVHLIRPGMSEAEILRAEEELGNLYTANLAPDAIFQKLHAFEHLLHQSLQRMFHDYQFDHLSDLVGQTKREIIADVCKLPEWNMADFESLLNKGGMLNRWHPTPGERMEYPKEYESPRDQMRSELRHESPVPGRFFVMGLRAPDGTLASAMSYRLPYPGDNISQHAAYAKYLMQRFNRLDSIDEKSLRHAYRVLPGTMEFDTLNVRAGWKGAGTRQFAEVLRHVAATEATPPSHAFLYRCCGIGAACRSLADAFIVGKNHPSEKLVHGCGFHDIGIQRPQHEQDAIAREVLLPDGQTSQVIRAWVQWMYGWGPFRIIHQSAENRLRLLYAGHARA